MKNIFCILFFLTFCLSAMAQSGDHLILTGRYKDQKVELRWYPNSAAGWRFANQHGYILERMELDESGQNTGWKRLSAKPILPFTKTEWESKADLKNEYVNAVYKTLTEPHKSPDRNAPFEKTADYQNEENAIYLFFTLATNMSPQASLGAGMRFEDNNIVSGKKYAYRLSFNGLENPVSEDTTFTLIEDTKSAYVAPKVSSVRLEEGEGMVKVLWLKQPNKAYFTTYFVEKSTDGKLYQRLNKLPILFAAKDNEEIFYVDSVANYKPAHYRVVGQTPFGDISTPSDAIVGMGRDRTPPMGANNPKAQGNRSTMTVSWDLLLRSADLKGFYVGRSSNVEGPFTYLHEKPLPVDARSFVDKNPQVFEPFYIVYGVDTAGNLSPAFATLANVFDTIAPAKPLGLSGSIDTNGVVTLLWSANKEADLAGYHVFTANSPTDVFQPITPRPLKASGIQDTVNMKALNKPVYYKITAVDYNNNPSPYSELLELKRPDLIPPAAPLLYDYNVLDGAVTLKWYNSSSDDVKEHVLYRRKTGAPAQALLTIPQSTQTSYLDKEVVMKESYEYYITAYDEAGNQTSSDPIQLTVYDNGVRPAIEGLRVSIDKESGTAKINWQYSAKGGAYRFVIFRSISGQQLASYRSVDANTFEFTDVLRKNGSYAYAIKAIYEDGGESPLTEAKVVVLE